VDFLILGQGDTQREGASAWLGPMLQALAGTLVIAAGRPVLTAAMWHPREFWHEATLRSHVNHPREKLDRLEQGSRSLITISNDGFSLCLIPEQLDTTSFQSRYEDGAEVFERTDYALAAEVLREGRGLWRGFAACEGLSDRPLAAARSLATIRASVQASCREAEFALGQYRDLAKEVRQLTSAHPSDQHIIRLYVSAVYRGSDAGPVAAICGDGLKSLQSMAIDASQVSRFHLDVLQRSLGLKAQRIFDVPSPIRTFTGALN